MDKKQDEIAVNSRGQVRPKTYKSKFKKARLETTTTESTAPTVLTEEYNNDYVNANHGIVPHLQLEDNTHGNENEENILQGNNEDDIIQNDDEENMLQENNEENTLQDNSEEDKLLNFLKEKEGVSVDELIKILESENKWIEENDDDNDMDEEDFNPTEEVEPNEDEPIQPGHFLSIKTSVLLIWLLALTFSFTSEMLSATLTIINLHMTKGYPALRSLYRFKRFFRNLKSPFIRHYYCAFCYAKSSDTEEYCSNEVCGKDLSKDNSKEYFIELPVISQLNALFAKKEFRDGLLHKQNRVKQNDHNIEDVYDSENYKKLMENNGPLSLENKNNLSFIFNTDGIPIFKSSKTSAWPIFLMINELPYRMRKQRENMIICGLWFSKNKPDMNLYCQPFHETLLKLEKGVNVEPIGQDYKIRVHGYLYSVSCDIPARSAVMNMNQHNGECCCPKCLQKGENFRTPTGGNIRIFPYQAENPTGPERTAENLLQSAHETAYSKVPVNGVKGPSFLMISPYYDPVENIAIDVMHLLYLGIVRLMMKLWFGVSHSLQPFSLYRFVDIVDERLTHIKPSHLITRMPRSIGEHLKFWKAAELRSWFFYYSLPCISNLMHPRYLYHYCALLEGIYLLNQASISDKDIDKSERLLKYFVFMFPCLYDDKFVTINMYSLLHLPDTVKKIGPLWSTSCFSFESANGDLLKMFHGTQYIDIQIINAVHVFQMLPSLSDAVSETSGARQFVSSLLKRKVSKLAGFQIYGKSYDKKLDRTETRLMTDSFSSPLCIDKICFYKRAILRGIMYHSLDYSRTKTRNSYTVKFKNKTDVVCFGYVCWYFAESDCEFHQETYACISLLEFKQIELFNNHYEGLISDQNIESNFMNIILPHIHFVKESNKKIIVPIENILDLCLCIKFDDVIVVCEESNHYEVNL